MKTVGCCLIFFFDLTSGFFKIRFIIMSIAYAKIRYRNKSKTRLSGKEGDLFLSVRSNSRKCNGYPTLIMMSVFPAAISLNGN